VKDMWTVMSLRLMPRLLFMSKDYFQGAHLGQKRRR